MEGWRHCVASHKGLRSKPYPSLHDQYWLVLIVFIVCTKIDEFLKFSNIEETPVSLLELLNLQTLRAKGYPKMPQETFDVLCRCCKKKGDTKLTVEVVKVTYTALLRSSRVFSVWMALIVANENRADWLILLLIGLRRIVMGLFVRGSSY